MQIAMPGAQLRTGDVLVMGDRWIPITDVVLTRDEMQVDVGTGDWCSLDLEAYYLVDVPV